MYPKIVQFRKKWLKHEFVPTANLFPKVLNETGHLCHMMESDALLVYELQDRTNVSFSKLQKLNKMSETERLEAKRKISWKTEIFVLISVKQGKERTLN